MRIYLRYKKGLPHVSRHFTLQTHYTYYVYNCVAGTADPVYSRRAPLFVSRTLTATHLPAYVQPEAPLVLDSIAQQRLALVIQPVVIDSK